MLFFYAVSDTTKTAKVRKSRDDTTLIANASSLTSITLSANMYALRRFLSYH